MVRLLLILSFSIATNMIYGQNNTLSIIMHSHNDYSHSLPLFSALDAGFTSIEVDIHHSRNNLKVSHNRFGISSKPDLKQLYLEPLDSLYREGFFDKKKLQLTLMIDLKSKKKKSLILLDKMIKNYDHLFQKEDSSGNTKYGPVILLISGNPPTKTWLKIDSEYFYLDGRLGKKYPNRMKQKIRRISAPLKNIISKGELLQKKTKSYQRLKHLINSLYNLGYEEVRFWETNDTENTWRALIDVGANVISVDDIDALSLFLRER